MPFLSGGHLWLILILLVIVLIIWGPGKLPDVGAGMGRAIREFKKASNDTKESFMSSHSDAPAATPPAAVAPSVAPSPVDQPTPVQADAGSRPAPVSEEHRVSS